MKKILFTAFFCFTLQIFAAPADTGCMSLQNSNWDGVLDYMDGGTQNVVVIIQTLSPLPPSINYSMSGNINGENFINAACIPEYKDPTKIWEVTFNSAKNNQTQSSLVAMFFDNPKDPKQINNLMGSLDGNLVDSGTISRA